MTPDRQVGYGALNTSGGGAVHALHWSGSAASVVDLNPIGITDSYASSAAGTQIVGWGHGPATQTGTNMYDHALLWNGPTPDAVDLHSYLPSTYTQSQALGIDSAGNIIGYAFGATPANTPFPNQAVIWMPVPEPTGISLLSAGSVIMLARRRRRL